MASVAAWRCTAGTNGLGATALWSSSFRDNRLLSKVQVCTSWSGSGYKSHPGLVTHALLDKTAPGSSGQNGRSEPRDSAREPLERLFSQASRYEERIAGSKYESEEGLEVAVTELEVDLKSAVDALRNKEEQLRAAEETLKREQSDIENTKSAPKVNSQKNLSYDLPIFDSRKNTPVDLVVVGGGPAGLAVAQRVSSEGLKVLCIDPEPRSVWPNNYGVWVDEFEAMDLLDCLDYTWASAVVHLDDKRRKTLDRPYGRVNRTRLKSKMIEQCISNGVQFYQSKVKHVTHSKDRSFVQCDDGTMVETAVVLDATGHSRRLVQYDKPFNPGYQIAYGIVAEVDEHPFDVDKMLFMDWRDSHLANTALEKGNRKLPTFLYAMPFSSTRIFLEETSLVARPGVPLDVIQKRMELRLKHLGINVKSIEEDEICVIPMGGVLPVIPQRVLGIGGTAGMVHPSTGYMVARTLAAAPILADALVKRLGGCRSPQVSPSPIPAKDSDTGSAQPRAVQHGSPSGDEISAGVWADLWPVERQYQREFFCFGMDVLLRLDLIGTRRFFDSFFSLEPRLWQGFLSSRLYFVELLGFGLSLFAHASNTARAEIVYKGTGPLLNMIKNLALMKR